MDLFVTLKSILKRINQIDKRSRFISENELFSSNPFKLSKNKTYVWVETKEDFNGCNINKNSKIANDE